MTDTLIARLRDWRGDPDEVMSEAADRIEALQARLTALELQEPVAYVAGTYGGHFTYRTINPAMVLPQHAALFLAAGTAPKEQT